MSELPSLLGRYVAVSVEGCHGLDRLAGSDIDNIDFLNVVGRPPRMRLNLNGAAIKRELVCHTGPPASESESCFFFDLHVCELGVAIPRMSEELY